ncbi:thiamine pyrophosphokinase [Bombardia bombarda]|uniref:Thiamine pyrophosphokinase n=1 Tax=Bombardia bombarda TaxID=252184 RepID=A0AA39WUU7_9PEZI|nr:thiamine pyrophosphokinase [Bombardia bombarda]
MTSTSSSTAASESLNPDGVEWHPSALVRDTSKTTQAHAQDNNGAARASAGFALVVLNQPLTHLTVMRRLWHNASFHIAADGGANCLYDVGPKKGDPSFDNLRIIIGDLDSLTDDVRAYFEGRSTTVIHDPDQYSTDFSKAVKHIRDRCQQANEATQQQHAVDIVAIGGLGGRVDQGLSQLHHLYLFQAHPRYADGRMYLFSGESLTFLLKGGCRHFIHVREEGEVDAFGKYVGILPVKEPSRITTKGLEWDVTDWETQFGGQVSTSNHVLPETKVVEVETTRDVLFTIALKEL